MDDIALTELAPQRASNASDEESFHGNGTALPRVDGGKDAWLALAGAFTLEALVWGFPFSFGIFQTYYSTHEPFSRQPSGIPAISTTATAIMFLSSPLVAMFIQRWPSIRRRLSLVGLVVTVGSLVAASFVRTTSGLLATQGVMFGLGGLVSTIHYACESVVVLTGFTDPLLPSNVCHRRVVRRP
jgi:hypothetical protein